VHVKKIIKKESIFYDFTIKMKKNEHKIYFYYIMPIENQDFHQRMNVASTLTLELYRVLMGAFLMVFVPQKCDENVCSISENINRTDPLSRTALAFNSLTLLAFLILYVVEVKRENKLLL
jgi:hypothetical protein